MKTVWPVTLLLLFIFGWAAYLEDRQERREARLFKAANACYESTRKEKCAGLIAGYIGD